MTRFKQVREAARNLAVRATGDDGEEAKLDNLPSDQSQQDDADENNRNPDGSAEDQVEKSVKPIYVKTENGVYTLNTESVEIQITENTIDDIKKLTTLSQSGTVRFADGSSAKVSPETATALLQTHGNLNTNNQKKFAKKLASSASEFAKLEKFALQQAKLTGRLYALNDL